MIPFYKIVVNEDDDTGVDFNAFVDAPAHMKGFIAFGKDQVRYSFNDEKRIVTGVMISTGTPIYRADEQFGEHYVIFDAPTVDMIRKKFFKQGYNQNVNADHDPNKVIDGATLLDSYIINSKDPKFPNAPEAFEHMKLQDGSWIASYHVTDDAIWQGVKDGKFNGFSVEGWFDKVKINIKQKHSGMNVAHFKSDVTNVTKWDVEIEQDNVKEGDKLTRHNQYNDTTVRLDAGEYVTKEGVTFLVDADGVVQKMGFRKTDKMTDKKQSLFDKFKSLFDEAEKTEQNFASATDAEGKVIMYEGELGAGTQLFIESEGEQLPAPEGDYQLTLEDGSVRIAMVDGSGIITSIEEFTDEDVETPATVDTELRTEVEELMAGIAKEYKAKFEKQDERFTAIEKENKSMKAELSAIKKGEKFEVKANAAAATEKPILSSTDILKNSRN